MKIEQRAESEEQILISNVKISMSKGDEFNLL
jgi:hypothetical protein